MNTAQWKMDTKIGPLYLVAAVKGLRGVFFERQKAPFAKTLKGSAPETRTLSRAVKQLEEYFAGRRRDFDLPLDAEGTEFQKRVWDALGKIPYGKTNSYRGIARKIKNEKAVRAVGNANGKNPLCVIVPCHRVIASDGSLGGYSGGTAIKTLLLDLEQKAGQGNN